MRRRVLGGRKMMERLRKLQHRLYCNRVDFGLSQNLLTFGVSHTPPSPTTPSLCVPYCLVHSCQYWGSQQIDFSLWRHVTHVYHCRAIAFKLSCSHCCSVDASSSSMWLWLCALPRCTDLFDELLVVGSASYYMWCVIVTIVESE